MTAVGHVFFCEAHKFRPKIFDARHHLVRLLEEFHLFEMICTVHGQNLRELVEAEVLGLFLTDRYGSIWIHMDPYGMTTYGMSIWDEHMGRSPEKCEDSMTIGEPLRHFHMWISWTWTTVWKRSLAMTSCFQCYHSMLVDLKTFGAGSCYSPKFTQVHPCPSMTCFDYCRSIIKKWNLWNETKYWSTHGLKTKN